MLLSTALSKWPLWQIVLPLINAAIGVGLSTLPAVSSRLDAAPFILGVMGLLFGAALGSWAQRATSSQTTPRHPTPSHSVQPAAPARATDVRPVDSRPYTPGVTQPLTALVAANAAESLEIPSPPGMSETTLPPTAAPVEPAPTEASPPPSSALPWPAPGPAQAPWDAPPESSPDSATPPTPALPDPLDEGPERDTAPPAAAWLRSPSRPRVEAPQRAHLSTRSPAKPPQATLRPVPSPQPLPPEPDDNPAPQPAATPRANTQPLQRAWIEEGLAKYRKAQQPPHAPPKPAPEPPLTAKPPGQPVDPSSDDVPLNANTLVGNFSATESTFGASPSSREQQTRDLFNAYRDALKRCGRTSSGLPYDVFQRHVERERQRVEAEYGPRNIEMLVRIRNGRPRIVIRPKAT